MSIYELGLLLLLLSIAMKTVQVIHFAQQLSDHALAQKSVSADPLLPVL
jgi:hypothetical protein